jgi:hypothetical protein
MPVYVGFVVYKVVLEQVFLLICSFSLFIIIQSMLSVTIDQLCGILVIDSNTEYPKHTKGIEGICGCSPEMVTLRIRIHQFTANDHPHTWNSRCLQFITAFYNI